MALIEVNFGGNKSALARSINRSPNYIHRLCLPLDNKGSKALGESLARTIELELNMPLNWFDTNDPHPDWHVKENLPIRVNALTKPATTIHATNNDSSGYVVIKLRRINLTTGGDLVLEDDDMPPLAFRKAWLAANELDPDQLVVAYVKDGSMCPIICDGATVVISTADKSITDGKIYALKVGGQLLIRRFYRRTASVLICAENESFGNEEVPINEVEAMHIIGRVVWSAGSL